MDVWRTILAWNVALYYGPNIEYCELCHMGYSSLCGCIVSWDAASHNLALLQLLEQLTDSKLFRVPWKSSLTMRGEAFTKAVAGSAEAWREASTLLPEAGLTMRATSKESGP